MLEEVNLPIQASLLWISRNLIGVVGVRASIIVTTQEMAQELLDRKMKHIAETGASIIVTSNPGCMMQIALGTRQRGLELEVMHAIQLLDAAYQASGQYTVAEKVRGTRQHWPLFLGIGGGLLIVLLLRWRKRRTNRTTILHPITKATRPF
jgi:glycolate oxidase iron-sulfur subunit